MIESSQLFLNPKLPSEERTLLQKMYQQAPTLSEAHLWIASSGSSQASDESVKLIALSKTALMASAQAVNVHLQATAQDIWSLNLPRFHIGGFSIEVRAALSQSRVEEFLDWKPAAFVDFLKQKKITLASLVPTQVYDLVKMKAQSPSTLRAVVVGGAALAEDLYLEARQLGWPLLPSYGLTECASQVATARLASLKEKKYPLLQKLSHVSLSLNQDSQLQIKSASLLSGYLQKKKDQTQFYAFTEEWLSTEDRAEINGDFIKPLGRSSDFVKILGEGVNLKKIEEIVSRTLPFLQNRFVVLTEPDSRRGVNLILVAEENLSLENMQKIEAQLAPFERIQRYQKVDRLPRSELGKILKTKVSLYGKA